MIWAGVKKRSTALRPNWVRGGWYRSTSSSRRVLQAYCRTHTSTRRGDDADPSHPLRLRKQLMWAIAARLERDIINNILGVARPRVVDLIAGRAERFILDALVTLAGRVTSPCASARRGLIARCS